MATETTVQAPDTGLKKFNERLRDFFHPGIKLNEQEETIMNIIYKILEAPETEKITPRGGPYYLVNTDIHYFVRVGCGTVSIVNTVDSVSRDCTEQFTSYIWEAIDRSVKKDIDLIESTTFRNGMKILDKISEKLEVI